MLNITNRTIQTTKEQIPATVYEGEYTAHEDGEGSATHTYRLVIADLNTTIVSVVVDGEDLSGNPDWEETVWAVVTGEDRC